MADTFPLGSIPPLSVWEGEKLSFTVTSSLGERVKFTKRATPSPKGKTSIDERTGVFTYEPSAEDKEEIAVWIRARKGAKEEAQKVYITPHPQLPSEFNVIEHVSASAPDPASRTYTTYAEVDAGEMRFNNIEELGDGAGAKSTVMTKKVTISGVKLVIERNEDKGSLYNRLKDRTNLKQLTLCADEVVIRCELVVPGTDVNIYARQLRFDDSGGEIARINTTPLPVKGRATRDEGLDGQKAGDVNLYIRNLDVPGNAHRIIANGSRGQDARLGIAGPKPKSLTWTWDGRAKTKTIYGADSSLEWTQEVKNIEGGFVPIAVAFIKEMDGRVRNFDFGIGSGDWPGDGGDPEVFPGRPGQGGDGGTILSDFKDELASRVQQKAGEAGGMAKDVPPTPAGLPNKACWVDVVYKQTVVGNEKVEFSVSNIRTSSPGYGAAAQGPKTPAPKDGQLRAVFYGGSSFWLHPSAVRAFLRYMDDAMLTGHARGELRERLAYYRGAAKAAAKTNKEELVWTALDAEVSALLQRVDGPYDYFGNPAGWVPMLSFQANHQLYKNEIEGAIRAMFLAYWVENTQKRQEAVAKTLGEAIKRLRQESDQALDDLKAAEEKANTLKEQFGGIKQDIEDEQKNLKIREDDLKRQAKNNLQVEHILRSSAKLLGGVMQLIPVGQPVLGAFGKSFTVLSDIDLDNPSKSIGGVAGAFSIVATDVIAPKIYEKLKLASDEEKEVDAKKEAYNKELAKTQVKDKVKKHMEDQKAAKDSVFAAFAGFAVSEDDIKERLERMLAECPEFKEVVEKVKALNARKAAFAEELLAVLQAIDVATTTILTNQLSLIELRAQLNVTLERLDLEALQYVQGMGHRARNRLLLYQYYLLKSYHYLMLEGLPIVDFRAQQMFDRFSKLLPDSADGILADAQYKSLSSVFEDQLKEVAKKIITWYQAHSKRHTGSFIIGLSDEQLETINGPAKSLELDLLWKLDRQREDIRITKIETEAVGLAEPLPKTTANLSLAYTHEGVSRVRRGGRLYLFRSGEYGGAAGYRNDKIHWDTDIAFNPKPGAGKEKMTFTNSEADAEEESLVRYLISDGKDDNKNPVLSFRPSAWARLTLGRSGDYTGKLDNLTLKVQYVYHSVDTGKLATVVVKVNGDAQPYIRCDTLDENGRGDGLGGFVRTFNKKTRSIVKLRAPARYGRRAFKGWQITGDAELKTGQELALDLSKRLDYEVAPVYEPLEFSPVNDKNEEWPACPVGWSFDDWLFEYRNKDKKELTIYKLDCKPWRGGDGYQPAVNEPQGNNQIKLSFERLTLMPGESTKISVCTNPEVEGSGGDQIMFSWGGDYGVFFDGNGNLNGLRVWRDNGWADASGAFDLDKENRTLIFRA